MQTFNLKNKLHSTKIVLLFVAVLILAFLPLTSFLFSLKNDAFRNYFPPKFFMSESIHAGFLPLWNPYINYGIPQYADMNAGYWSPVTWIIASTIGYNAYTFTIELLLYLLFGGLGMYKLTGLWHLGKSVRLIAGFSFMCCGFNVGHLQHFNWLSGAAILPWCFWSYYVMLNHTKSKTVIISASFFYLFIASAHPGLIIGATYFFLAIFIYKYYSTNRFKIIQQDTRRLLFRHGLLIITLLFLGAGIISGYLDVLPYFLRGDKISLTQSLSNPTPIQSWISSLLPFTTVRNDAFFLTDISMRNSYFSLTLFIFFLCACLQHKTGWQKFLFINGILFALLSSGGIFKSFAYDVLPMIGYVRLNGEFRIFSLICFILISAIELNKFLSLQKPISTALRTLMFAIGGILSALTLFSLFKVIGSQDSFLFKIDEIVRPQGIAAKLKLLVDKVSFWDTLLIQGIIQLIFLYLIWGSVSNINHNLLLKLTAINLILSTLLNVPYTGAGQTSVKTIQTLVNKSPKGIPQPTLHPIRTNDSISVAEKKIIGDWNLYNKQIGNLSEYPYPIVLKTMRAYYTDADESQRYLDKAFLFGEPLIKSDKLKITAYSPNAICLKVLSDSGGVLVLQHNYYPHWYYQNDSETYPINRHGISFMSVPLQKGSNNIRIFFNPKIVRYMMLLSIISILAALVYLLLVKLK